MRNRFICFTIKISANPKYLCIKKERTDAVILYIVKKNILDGLKSIVYFKRLFSIKSKWISNRIH